MCYKNYIHMISINLVVYGIWENKIWYIVLCDMWEERMRAIFLHISIKNFSGLLRNILIINVEFLM